MVNTEYIGHHNHFHKLNYKQMHKFFTTFYKQLNVITNTSHQQHKQQNNPILTDIYIPITKEAKRHGQDEKRDKRKQMLTKK